MALVRGLLRRDLHKMVLGLRNMSSEAGLSSYSYETLKVTTPVDHVFHVELNRPEKRNAMNKALWREMVLCFQALGEDANCRAVVVSGAGKMFTSGIDLMDLASDFLQPRDEDVSRIAWNIRKKLCAYQESFSVIEKCTKPVIAAIHNACLGAGVSLITACDIRYCTQDAYFQVKEVDIGLAADVGALQRLPHIIGSRSLVNELAFTSRKMMSDEALSSGLVSRVFPDNSSLLSAALELATEIASKSPVAVQGTKVNLLYSRDHSVQESLDYMATWNMSMLQSQDIVMSAQAALQKKTPKDVTFSKL
ncbi:delta(3,5)-Delta(2,4)-dienoyl-CoA isomerase, mitochondrial isoform X4 [Bufo gargarizans]|uniref:delta(3,5)-Delta(2,4)-dienoyl-CoA isomerase, mitochondrial isoform X1 n=1 Tax=Bufo gargarizans TaxID=30331 RepID=UPI001CF3D3D0|nr:delta(3,5)-Delta(2,4)-dienoyl-CoA isomerase, mitochondrial isoform X1 [Bufo gargarizans]XP_044161156.1 delta(3,5)-Delta(2,4)-dienoyl-CoA isomerase, mitochondrial isoform X4 [Bufo gargarizans]